MLNYKNFIIHKFDELNSTNSYAFNLAKNNQAFDREIFVADKQTSGRGRLDRKWQSELGNLFCSILLRPKDLKIPVTDSHKLSFLTILALRNSLNNDKAQIKWPNDLLINGKKVAGILLESDFIDNYLNFAVIGVGVNITSHPDNVLFEATSFANEGIAINKDEFLRRFLDEFEKLYKFVENFGIAEAFKNIRKSCVKDAYKLGEKVEINLGDKKVSGIFEDIDENGGLVLRDDDKKFSISFGDVC